MLDVGAETERLARLVADKIGKTPEQVVHEAVRASAEAAGVTHGTQRLSREQLIAGMEAIAERTRGLAIHDTREPDDILGYGDNGLPR